MGQTISFPHVQLPGRKSERLRLHAHEATSHNNNGSFVRRSSMGGRLRSYGVILYEPPTPTPTSNGPTSEEDAASTPSPVVNDMISVQWPAKTKTKANSTVTTLTTTTERSFASWTPSSSSTATPRRRIGPSSTSSMSPAARASPPLGLSDAIVSVQPKSRATHDRIMLSSSATSSTASSTTTMLVCGGSKSMMVLPQHAQLPKLRLGELEQIFAAIVTSDDGSTRAKIALST